MADGSALAGAITKGSVENRKSAALAYVTANGPKLYGITLTPDVQVSGKNVSVKIATVVNGTLLTVLFNKMDALTGAVVSQASPALPSVAFDVSSSAFAETGNSGSRCLIALNSTMADAI